MGKDFPRASNRSNQESRHSSSRGAYASRVLVFASRQNALCLSSEAVEVRVQFRVFRPTPSADARDESMLSPKNKVREGETPAPARGRVRSPEFRSLAHTEFQSDFVTKRSLINQEKRFIAGSPGGERIC